MGPEEQAVFHNCIYTPGIRNESSRMKAKSRAEIAGCWREVGMRVGERVRDTRLLSLRFRNINFDLSCCLCLVRCCAVL